MHKSFQRMSISALSWCDVRSLLISSFECCDCLGQEGSQKESRGGESIITWQLLGPIGQFSSLRTWPLLQTQPDQLGPPIQLYRGQSHLQLPCRPNHLEREEKRRKCIELDVYLLSALKHVVCRQINQAAAEKNDKRSINRIYRHVRKVTLHTAIYFIT